MGDMSNATLYAALPEAVVRWGYVVGLRCRLILEPTSPVAAEIETMLAIAL
jgi:hypothetical protein